MNRSVSQATLLEGVIVMAATDSKGHYVPLPDLSPKITAVKAMTRRIHTIVVATGQGEKEPEDGAYKLIKATGYKDAIRQLEENGGLFGEALRKRAREERSALWLPDHGHSDADWEKLYQIPRLKKVEIVKDTSPSPDKEKDHEDRRMSVSGWEEALGAEHFSEIDRPVDAGRFVRQLLDTPYMNGIILGPPGSGKSSFLGWLTQRLAHEQPASNMLRPFPILVRLAKWEEEGAKLELEDYLVRLTKKALPDEVDKRRTFLQGWLNRGKGRIILLFDGLDEVGEPFFNHFAEIIKELRQRNSRFLVSCRTVSRGRYEALGLPIYYVDAFTPEQRDAYIDAFPWKSEYADRCEKLKEHLPTAPNIQALSTNPLMLSFLCHTLNTNAEISLPIVRVELIGKVLRNMLTSEPTGRARPEALEKNLAELPKKNFRPQTIMNWLGKIAFALFESEGKSSLVFDADRFEKICQKKAGLDDKLLGIFITEMQWRGIIRPHPGGYMFFHLIIQEYLVALELARRLEKKRGLKKDLTFGGKEKELGEWLYDWSIDPRWEEIMLLTAGLLEEPAGYLAHIYEPARDTLFRHRLSLAARMTGEISQQKYENKSLKDAAKKILDEARDDWINSDNRNAQEAIIIYNLSRAGNQIWLRPDRFMKADANFQQSFLDRKSLSNGKTFGLFMEINHLENKEEIIISLMDVLRDRDLDSHVIDDFIYYGPPHKGAYSFIYLILERICSICEVEDTILKHIWHSYDLHNASLEWAARLVLAMGKKSSGSEFGSKILNEIRQDFKEELEIGCLDSSREDWWWPSRDIFELFSPEEIEDTKLKTHTTPPSFVLEFLYTENKLTFSQTRNAIFFLLDDNSNLPANRPPITTLLEECASSKGQPEVVRKAAHEALKKIRGE